MSQKCQKWNKNVPKNDENEEMRPDLVKMKGKEPITTKMVSKMVQK